MPARHTGGMDSCWRRLRWKNGLPRVSLELSVRGPQSIVDGACGMFVGPVSCGQVWPTATGSPSPVPLHCI